MRIIVRAKTGSREAGVEKLDDTHFVVAVKALPEKGRANKEIVAVLSDYFGLSKSKIKITSGHTAKTKLVSVSRLIGGQARQ